MLLNKTKERKIAEHIEVAATFWHRFKGLMGRSHLPGDSCLIITKCNSVHTCFMSFPIDVVFLNQDNLVLYTIENMLPFRCSPFIKGACTVVELASGTIQRANIEVGDTLSWG